MELTLAEKYEEYKRCKEDPIYFICNYIWVVHPVRGLVKFNLYKFQRKIIKDFLANRFNILRKFRQAGCTTLVSAFSLWRATFTEHYTVAILSKGDVESTEVLDRIKLMYDNLPEFLRSDIVEDNKHTLKFKNGSVIKSRASGRQSGRSLAGSLLILDEAAFIETIDTIWAAVYPIISTGGSVISLSTVNGTGNWFHQKYSEARRNENEFNAIDINWKDHPEYYRHEGYEWLYKEMESRSPPVIIDNWEKTTRRNLTHKEWLQEYECEFLGTGDTYIAGDILAQLRGEVIEKREDHYKNRLRIYKHPEDVYYYAIGVDCGLGRGRDYSAFHVINLYNGEQVAEFRSNYTPLNGFAKVVFEVAKYYNNAYVLPERNNIGLNFIHHLVDEFEYDNVMKDENGEWGIQISQKNRENLLADMEHYIREGKIKLCSERVVDELLTFIIDENGKITADVNCNDDLVMSLAFTIYAFKTLKETTPMLNHKPNDINNPILANDPYKYTLKSITGNSEEEDLRWLLRD